VLLLATLLTSLPTLLTLRTGCSLQGRTPADLIRALRQRFIADPLMVTGLPSLASFDWAALGAEASLIHRTAPGINCMFGPLSAEVSWHISLHLKLHCFSIECLPFVLLSCRSSRNSFPASPTLL
jgi:hypothetical protein